MATTEQPVSPSASSQQGPASGQAISESGFPGSTFEPPSPTQHSSHAVAWGLANAGAAPPNSPFLFAASQAAALDQPVLPPPPLQPPLPGMASVATAAAPGGDADQLVGSPEGADNASMPMLPSLGTMSNASLASGSLMGQAPGSMPVLAAPPLLPASARDVQLAAMQQLPNQQYLQHTAARPPRAPPQVHMVVDPRTGLPMAIPAAPQLQQPGLSSSQNMPPPMQPPSAVEQHLQQLSASMAQPLSAALQQQHVPMQQLSQDSSAQPQPLARSGGSNAAAEAALLQQQIAAQQQQALEQHMQQQAQKQAMEQHVQQQAQQQALEQHMQQQAMEQQAQQAAASEHQLSASMQQQMAGQQLAGDQTLQGQIAAQQQQQAQLGSSSPGGQAPPASAVIAGMSALGLSSALPPPSAAQIAAAVANQQAAQQLQQAKQAVQQHQQQQAAALLVASAGQQNAAASLAASGFPGFTPAPMSHPMPLMGGAMGMSNMSAALGHQLAPSPVVPQTTDLNTLVAHFENQYLTAAGGGLLTPAMTLQAQQAARNHLASQQLAFRFAAAQNPMARMWPTGMGGMDPTAAALGAASASSIATHPAAVPCGSISRTSVGSDVSSLAGVSAADAAVASSVRAIRTGAKIKVVISAGGRFVKKEGPDGGLEYQGGETRLVSIPSAAKFRDVLESLDRVASGSITSASSAGFGMVRALKYQLPSSPNVYVDVVDDEDVAMMLDEWRETVANTPQGSTPSRLHIFVQWRGATSNPMHPSADSEVSNPMQQSAESEEPQHHSAGSVVSTSSANASAVASPRPGGFEGLAERMEVIRPSDIQLVKFLGAGGYGEVYLGKWHGSECAVKCLNPGLFFGGGDMQDHSAVADLVKEADILGSLRHPNVVWVYGMVLPDPKPQDGEQGHSDSPTPTATPAGPGTVRAPAIVTEYMSGGSLRSALSRRLELVQGGFTRLLVALDAAKGVEYLHSKGIVHFDLKSANLLLGHRDRRVVCKVADFGLSKQKQQTYVSGVSSSRGTLPWIAPEIIKSPDAVTEKVDVYSYGIVLWELWTGREPFEGLNYHALLHQMTSAGRTMRPPLPGHPDWDPSEVLAAAEPAPGYRDLLERCWCERPSQRPSFATIVKELATMASAVRPRRRQPAQPPGSNPASGSTAGGGSAPASNASIPQPNSATTLPSQTPPPSASGGTLSQPAVDADAPAAQPAAPVVEQQLASGAAVAQQAAAELAAEVPAAAAAAQQASAAQSQLPAEQSKREQLSS